MAMYKNTSKLTGFYNTLNTSSRVYEHLYTYGQHGPLYDEY